MSSSMQPGGRGSSPHTRGALRALRHEFSAFGIIPAYAGSTRFRPCETVRRRDHPRIRGEHVFKTVGTGSIEGSSPHTRGARFHALVKLALNGIIPAYAGSTGVSRALGKGQRDHPRIRGEHFPAHRATSHTVGSSPHTRGAPSKVIKAKWNAGIIPAYAGSTSRPTSPIRG